MKIAIDARTMGSRPSGIGMYLYNFLKELINENKFEIVLFTDVSLSEHIRYFIDKGVEVRCFGEVVNVSAKVYRYFRFIRRELKAVKPDLFWEPNSVIPIKLSGDFKIMTTVHDTFPLDYEEYFGKLYKTYFKMGMRTTFKMADKVVYNSNQSRLKTVQHFDVAKDLSSYVSYVAIDSCGQERTWDDFVCSYKDYFLYVGNLEKRKGTDVLIKAYERYVQMGGSMSLVIAGKVQEKEISDMINEVIQRTKKITYLNYVSEEVKDKLYKNCTCFVFPSMAEGFGMPVVEAMKYEKPILVRDLQIYDEIAGNCICRYEGGNNEVVALANALEVMEKEKCEPDLQAYADVRRRYSSKKLVPGLVEFMQQ